MKVQITHLKAPWPEGAKVGDVIDVNGDAVPAWAIGKCRPAPGEEAAPAPAGEQVAQDQAAAIEALKQQANEAFRLQEQEHTDQVKQLRADIESGGLALQEALTKSAALEAEVADLKAKLEAAQADEGKAGKGKSGKA